MLDGGFEAGKKGLAGFATIEVLFQLFAERIIELFVEVVGELGEEGFAGGGAFLGCCRGRARARSGFLLEQRGGDSAGPVFGEQTGVHDEDAREHFRGEGP